MRIFPVAAALVLVCGCRSEKPWRRGQSGLLPPPEPAFAVYQSRDLVRVVDGGAEAKSSVGCDRAVGDALIAVGYSVSDPSAEIRQLVLPPGPAELTGATLIGSTRGALPPTVRAAVSCLHSENLAALRVLELESRDEGAVTAQSGQLSTAVSACPAGAWMIGGAFDGAPFVDASQAKHYGRITRLGPQGHAWVMRAKGGAGPYTFSTRVLCARAHTEVLHPLPTTYFVVPPRAPAKGAIGCPTGWFVLSGGFSFDDDAELDVIESTPGPDPGEGNFGPAPSWSVRVTSRDPIPRAVTLTAVCGRFSEQTSTPPPPLPRP